MQVSGVGFLGRAGMLPAADGGTPSLPAMPRACLPHLAATVNVIVVVLCAKHTPAV